MIKKILIVFFIIALIFFQTKAYGVEVPTPPAVPSMPDSPSLEQILSPTPEPVPPTIIPTEAPPVSEPSPTLTSVPLESSDNLLSPTPTSEPLSNSEIADHQVGETIIETGDVTSEGEIIVIGQTSTVVNDEQVNSDNQGSSIQQSQSTETSNEIKETSDTGANSASNNLGDSMIKTGEANAGATVVVAANTNIDGLTVKEFNVVDDQNGDLVLDFSLSDPQGPSASISEEKTFQSNDAFLENNLILTAASGENQTDFNTNGDSKIQTGDANVSANVINLANNNLEGNVLVGVVNIYGDLNGDIILPEELAAESSATLTSVDADSSNQTNEAIIENNFVLNANTGENQTEKNTGGDSKIETGETQVEVQTVNVANTNVDGGTWFIVLINQAGEWLGKIVDVSEGEAVSDSAGADLTISPEGNVSLSSSVGQENQGKIINNLNLSADTGHNSASENTGGNSTIKTGDAKVVANVVNFVNNNISSGAKVVVTVINVFGKWVGDFLPFGKKDTETPVPDISPTPIPTTTLIPELEAFLNETEDENITEDQVESEEELLDLELTPTPTVEVYRPKKLPMVAGVASETTSPQDLEIERESLSGEEPKKIRINLAWLTVTLPLLLISTLIKRKLS
ncbi:MAG: hypothetical protein M1514_01825 [Patescibacteria group bacterium]|nr:hypothetical protein [Patescibacteria group bacterium]